MKHATKALIPLFAKLFSSNANADELRLKKRYNTLYNYDLLSSKVVWNSEESLFFWQTKELMRKITIDEIVSIHFITTPSSNHSLNETNGLRFWKNNRIVTLTEMPYKRFYSSVRCQW